jgi:hypothetical protein
MAYLIAALVTALVTVQSILINFPVRMEAATLETSSEGRLLNQFSTGLRQTMASFVFLRCDEYMHAGDPVEMVVKEGGKVIKEQTMGVTWRTNREIVTLLQMVTTLDPAFTMAQTMLAEHLTRDRNRFVEGMSHLHRAILYNRDNPRLYMLYGQAGDIYFSTKLWGQAAGYLERSLELYARVTDSARAGTAAFEDEYDRMRFRSYQSYLASSYFELRDWPRCYKWWKAHGEFADENHITRWMRVWEQNPNASFRAEDYADHERVARTESNRHEVPDLTLETAKHQEVWLTPNFPREFYFKLLFLSTIVTGLVGTLWLRALW